MYLLFNIMCLNLSGAEKDFKNRNKIMYIFWKYFDNEKESETSSRTVYRIEYQNLKIIISRTEILKIRMHGKTIDLI